MPAGRWLVALTLALVASSAAARPGQAIERVHPTAYPTTGPPDAPVTVEVFFIPGAEPSHVAYRLVRGLAASHPTRVRAIYRPRAIGSRAAIAAVVLAAQRAGVGLALLDQLAAAAATPSLTSAVAAAVALGLPESTANAATRDPALLALLAASDADAFRAPTNDSVEIVVNGVPISRDPYRLIARVASPEQLEQIYRHALREARLAAVAGLTNPALRERHRRTGFCDEPDATEPTPLPSAGDFTWSLGDLLDGGSGCVEPRLAEGRPDEPRARDDLLGPPPSLTVAPLPLAGAPSVGAPDGLPIVVVCDLLGRGCRQQLASLRQLAKYYDGQVRLVWLPWVSPLVADTSYGVDALERAGLAWCAAELGDGWPFVDDPSTLARAAPSRAELLLEAGADAAAIEACLATAPLRMRGLVAAARAAGVAAGPTVIIAGRRYENGFVDGRAASFALEHALAPGVLGALVP